jgi:rhodanese-related sulfurtransferase
MLYIILALIIILFLLMSFPKILNKFDKKVKNISSDEAIELIKQNKNITILDVRNRSEFQAGHLEGSRLIPVNELSSRIKDLEKLKNRPILVYCQPGGGNPSAVGVLFKNNFTQIYQLKHGLATWKGKLKK